MTDRVGAGRGAQAGTLVHSARGVQIPRDMLAPTRLQGAGRGHVHAMRRTEIANEPARQQCVFRGAPAVVGRRHGGERRGSRDLRCRMTTKWLVQALFEACGDAAEVPQESHIDYCVGMTGSGAAFPALLAHAMVEHAVSRGLPVGFARRAAQGVLVNASQLLAESDDPAPIVQAMIDYRGTTAAALQAMIDGGFKTAVGAGLDAASAKAADMAAG